MRIIFFLLVYKSAYHFALIVGSKLKGLILNFLQDSGIMSQPHTCEMGSFSEQLFASLVVTSKKESLPKLTSFYIVYYNQKGMLRVEQVDQCYWSCAACYSALSLFFLQQQLFLHFSYFLKDIRQNNLHAQILFDLFI